MAAKHLQGSVRREGRRKTSGAALLSLCLLCAWPAAAEAEFAEGSAAYDGGDYATAFEIWHELAVGGDVAAQLAVADLYLAGTGVVADPAAAARWFRAAAERGDPIGQLNLGDLYSRGLGVERDPLEAYVWFSLAAAQGRRWAAGRLATLEQRLSPDQLSAAREALAARR